MRSKRLVRSTSDRVIAGVCGGIAEYFGWSADLLRLIFVIACLAGGSGIWLYIILWILMPEAEY